MTDDKIYTYIDDWDGNTLFTYIVILLLTIFICKKFKVSINIFIPILIGWFIISYLNHQSITDDETQEEILKLKEKTINNKLPKIVKNDDVINYLFSIQDIYQYNPQTYENMNNNIKEFFKLYKVSFVNRKNADINYGLMENYKREALNSLHSIIFNLPDDNRARQKLNNSILVLDKILTKYLDQISYVSDNYKFKNNIDNQTIMINYGSKPFNEYDDIFQPYSYEIY
jgi:hypothetical protein